MNGPAAAHQAVADLSVAFVARDVAKALSCFTAHDDISYTGSETGEHAHGRTAVRALLHALFLRAEAYTWQADEIIVHQAGDALHVTAHATGQTTHDHGTVEHFPYRITGLLQSAGPSWRWRVWAGSEPT